MFGKKIQETKDIVFVGDILFLLLYSLLVLRSIAPFLFPTYYFYIIFSLILFFLFSKVSFDIFSLFSKHFYIGSIIFLCLPIIIGQITRGTIRWINFGNSQIQPSEIVRPFLYIFFANYLSREELKLNNIVKVLLLFLLPFVLILIQPSLGVAVLTGVGFFGIILASNFNKKYLLTLILIIAILVPVVWNILAPYQKQRVMTFLNPQADPFGGGYNSRQSMITVGSGKLFGKGLGKGTQTQLSFLPEKHTDFIFASISEELGFVGSLVLIVGELILLFKLSSFINKTSLVSARLFVSGLFLVLLVQCFVHIGMNMGILPITGITLPLVSAGGSSLISTMMALGISLGSIK